MSKIQRLANRPGRSKNAPSRDQRVYVYFTTPEYRRLQKRLEQANAGLSVYMRTMALEGRITARLTEPEMHIFRGLITLSNTLHQLVQKARSDGLASVETHLLSLLTQLEEQLNKIHHAS